MSYLTKDILLEIVRDRNIETIIETGTGDGKSTRVMAKVFKKVHTVELSFRLFLIAKLLNKKGGIKYNHGDSVKFLEKILPNILEPVVFYLDAHWCKNYFGMAAKSNFPLWEELKVIREREYEDIIIIDDVHAFGEVRKNPYHKWQTVSPQSVINYIGEERIDSARTLNDQFIVYKKDLTKRIPKNKQPEQ